MLDFLSENAYKKNDPLGTFTHTEKWIKQSLYRPR